ncbi:unnamed protein product [Brugia timori]|uniref:Ovule protein n=1 Tax=Brugia timori TaxID=42155 RepID=A0A0R3Q4Z6_9BILA|nr:unnamed protein product [Brugia timori]
MSLPKLKQKSWVEGLLTFGVLMRKIYSEIRQSEMLNLSFTLSGYKITPHRLLNLKVICCITLERNLMCLPRTIVMYNTIILPKANVLILDFINRSSRINNL